MQFIVITGIAFFVCLAACRTAAAAEGTNDDSSPIPTPVEEEVPDSIEDINSNAVNRAAHIEEQLTKARTNGKSLVATQAFTEEELAQAKKLMACIRKEVAAKYNLPDPQDDSIVSDDLVKTKHQIELDASKYPNCQSLVKGKVSRKRRQVPTDANRWADNVVPWKFDVSRDTTGFYKKRIRDSLVAIEDVTCIDFVELSNSDPEPAHWIRVTDADDGCWSYLGRINSAGQQLNIQANRGGRHCQHTGVIQHEFIHALGVHHEHLRSDRDEYVTVNFGNIQNGKEFNFQICTTENCLPHQTPYDYGSVMHYGKTSFSTGGDTITPKDPNAEIGQRVGLSQSDAVLLNYLYPCPNIKDCGNCKNRSKNQKGCNVADIEECVCSVKPSCCRHRWNRNCENHVSRVCGFTCEN